MTRSYMKRIPSALHPIPSLLLSLTLYLPQCLHAQLWTNGQAASSVIGQPGFGSNAIAATSTGLSSPTSVIVDPATGKVFVADYNNNRVLRYASTAVMTDGAAAEAVFGQTDFTSNGIGTTATTLSYPSALALDASGSLWVADQINMRVLRFDNAATLASGAAANGVLGHTDFITANSPFGATAARLNEPNGVFCKGTTLWVADQGYNRILRFDNAASKANGANADAVLGEPDFTTVNYGVASATILSNPYQIYVDGSDNLWVADYSNNRVVMFPNASTAPNGEAATKVLGQSSFTARGSGTSASTLKFPWGVYGDDDGNIYVADALNKRVLVFADAVSLPNGATASYVLGQSNFNSSLNGDGANQMARPNALFFGSSLLVADADNNRVAIFTPPTLLSLLLDGFTGRLQDNGQVLLQWQVSNVDRNTAGSYYIQLEYSAKDTAGFTDVLSTQPVNPTMQNYNYLHVSPAVGVNYYRLMLIAPDGSATYSPIVSIMINRPAGSSGLSIYPNPAASSVVVTLPQPGGSQPGTAVIGMYNSSGMLVQRLMTGTTVNTIDISRLPAGTYTVRVVRGNNTATSSFVKVVSR